MKVYSDIQDAYIDGIKKIYEEGNIIDSVRDTNSVGSLFGKKDRKFKEIQGYSFVLSNPRSRIIKCPKRAASLGFSFANFIWVLSGRKDVESISYYNKRGLAFSDNGKYYESAFGDRIFGTYKLWEKAKKLLQSDPSTRRALIPIFFHSDIEKLPLDTSCAAYIQLLIRKNKLDMVLSMRSQSSILILPYDLFLFTMLQEYFSLSLNLEMGKLTYFCNSFHYYLEEEKLGESIINNYKKNKYNSVMPPMERLSVEMLKNLGDIETLIRTNVSNNLAYPEDEIREIPNYWKEVMNIIWTKAYKEDNGENYDKKLIPTYLENFLP